jgi:hypothetical protein
MYVIPEQDHHPLRAIRRALLESESDKSVDALRKSAADAFAALNGWYQNHWGRRYCPHDLSTAPKRWCGMCVGIPQRLTFLDYKGDLAAIVGQYCHEEDGELRELGEHLSLRVHTPPAHFASIFYPGARTFALITKPDTEVKWLPEQRERHGPFALHQGETPTFAEFLECYICEDRAFDATFEDLRRFRNFRGRRWAPPNELVSKAHLFSYVDSIPCYRFDSDVLAGLWSLFEHWRRDRISAICRFNKEILEIDQ